MSNCFAIVDKSPYHAARVNASRNAFFSSLSKKKTIFFDVDIVVKKNRMWFSVVCTVIDNDTAYHWAKFLVKTSKVNKALR